MKFPLPSPIRMVTVVARVVGDGQVLGLLFLTKSPTAMPSGPSGPSKPTVFAVKVPLAVADQDADLVASVVGDGQVLGAVGC